jgi:hypothetical protein
LCGFFFIFFSLEKNNNSNINRKKYK